MRYRDFAFYLATLGIVVLMTACQMTPERQAQFKSDMDALNCAQSLSFGSISTTGDRQHVPVGQAVEWCKARQRGQPYTAPQAVAPTVRIEQHPPPNYHCRYDGVVTRCSPM